MKREALFTKLVAMLLCAMMVVGCLPVAAFATNDWEGDIDVVEPDPGSEEAPIALTALENTVTVPAGSAMYYTSRHDGMIMTVTGTTGYEILVGEESTPDTEGTVTMNVVCASTVEPMTFAVVNNTEADVEYTIVFTYPEGSMENPKVASLYDQTVSVEAGDNDGYYLTYVADYTGTLSIAVSVAESVPGWAYYVNNLTSYAYGETQWSDSDPVVNPYIINVTAGDELQIMVNTYNPEDEWNNPAGDITVDITYVAGSCPEYPIILGLENTVTNEGTVYYQGNFAGMNVVIEGEGDFSVISDGQTIEAVDGKVEISYPAPMGRPMPNSIVINGDGEFTITATYPLGTMQNPATAVLGDNVCSIAAGGSEYIWNYTADYTGKLVVGVTTADGNWQYTINNATTYVYGDTQWSDSDPVVNPAVIDVTAGDVIEIKVITYNPDEMWSAPAGDITVNLAYQLGSCPEYPIILELENTVTNEGTVYYQGYFAGMNVVIEGEGDFSVISDGQTIEAVDGKVEISYPAAMGRPMPNSIVINGDGEFTITATYPLGTMQNPATAVLGDNVCSIAAGGSEYVWNYTAEKDGDLIVTVSTASGNWQYTINNATTYVYGDTQWSDSDPVVNPATIAVKAGDVIEIKVLTYDPANPWAAPAGDVTVNLAYKEIVPPSGTAALKFTAASLTLGADLKVTFTVNKDTIDAFENVYVIFEFNGKEITVTDYSVSGTKCYFALPGVAPRMMKDNILAKLYGTYEGQEFVYEYNYNASKYCYQMLKYYASNTKLCTLAVDLLNFAAAHQTYMNYNLENMVNAELTDAQKAMGSSGEQTFTSIMGQTGTNVNASFAGVTLTLSDAVIVRYTVKCNDLTGITLKLVVEGVEYIIPASEFIASGTAGTYYVNFTQLKARQMRETIEATVCLNGEATSKTLKFSVESYAARTASPANLVALVKAMMYYGDSAKAFLG